MTVKPLPANHEKLFAAVVSDALDVVGIANSVLPPRIRPLDDSLTLIGRARTGMYIETAEVEDGVNPYELEIKLVDDLKSNEIAVLACGGSNRIAPWGGLLSTASVGRGAAGCITDGMVRDILTIRKLKLPVYHNGIAPLDSKGRGQIMAIDVPVILAGVRIQPGDLLIGDADGVAVIPHQREDEVLAVAFSKVEGEDRSSADLLNGHYLRDVYARYGVL